MNESTSHRTVVLTGASRGIGRAMALELTRRGHRVFGCGTSAPQPVRREGGPQPAGDYAQVDVADASQVQRWAGLVLERAAAPDLLINNAGIINAVAPFWEIPADEFERVVEVDLLGVARVLRAFVPAMVARGRGIIVNISSGCGREGYPGVAAYCAGKFGLEGLSLALAEDLPAGMAAIPLSPGVIHTEMLADYWGERAAACESPERWARHAVPYILALGPEHNGRSLRIPQS